MCRGERDGQTEETALTAAGRVLGPLLRLSATFESAEQNSCPASSKRNVLN
jgi:hypothetical protein